MYTKIWVMIVIWGVSATHDSAAVMPRRKGSLVRSPQEYGPALAKAYTFEAVHPAPPDHLWRTAL